MAASRCAALGVLALVLLLGCKSGSVSGSVSGAAGVVVQLYGSQRVATTTGPDGRFSFEGLEPGSYALSPSLAGYTFTPDSRNLNVVGGDSLTGQDFTAVGGSGVLDTLFGSGGVVTFAPGDSNRETFSTLALSNDGRMLVATQTVLTSGNQLPRVVRFLADGGVDPSFGNRGIASLGLPGLLCAGNALAVAPDGRIVVAGGCRAPAARDGCT